MQPDDLYSSKAKWKDNSVVATSYICGYCNNLVTSDRGMALKIPAKIDGKFYEAKEAGVYICPHCHFPTFILLGDQIPGNRVGSPVKSVPEDVNNVYEEARRCFTVNAYTGTVLLCRKLLMHVAVDLGAKDDLKFVEYVNYLEDQHFVSVRSHEWVDQIRKYGNEATHEIQINTKEDAQKIIKFCEMILKMNYEYPSETNDSNK